MSPQSKPMSFESFAALRGVSLAYGDAGMHKRGHASETAWRRHMRRLSGEMRAHAATIEALRLEYAALIEAGELRPLSRIERLQIAANGHPDLQSTKAAKKLLKKALDVIPNTH